MRKIGKLIVVAGSFLGFAVNSSSHPTDSVSTMVPDIQGRIVVSPHPYGGSRRIIPYHAPQKASVRQVRDITQYSVGSIPFHEEATPSGAKVISVPFYTLPLRGAPQVGVQYNSQGGKGVAGYGWNVFGISAISVIGKTIWYDGSAEPISLNGPYALDGSRLVPNVQSSMSDYQFETAQGFVYVQKKTGTGGQPYFKVAYPDGSTAEFGDKSSVNPTYMYPIVSKMDADGYLTEYSYTKDENVFYISEIKYGGTNKADLPGRIEFQYSERADISSGYIGGIYTVEKKLLAQATSYNESDVLRRYSFSYSDDVMGTHLEEIACYNSEDEQVPPLHFSYGDVLDHSTETMVVSDTMYLQYYYRDAVYFKGKFLHNEKPCDGLVSYIPLSTYAFNENTYKFGSTYSPEQKLEVVPKLSSFSEVITVDAGEGFILMNPVDYDGDGIDEIVKINYGLATAAGSSLVISKYRVGTDGLTSDGVFSVPVYQSVNVSGYYSPVPRMFLFGDYDGDGRAELLTVSFSDTVAGMSRESRYILVDIQAGTSMDLGNIFQVASEDQPRIFVMDINGDGRSEYCIHTAAGCQVYSVSASGLFYRRTESLLNTSILSEGEWGDLNGDGLPDYVTRYYRDAPEGQERWEWAAMINTGNGFLRINKENWPDIQTLDRFFLQDVNYDGVSDLLILENGNLLLYKNTKGDFPLSATDEIVVENGSAIVDHNIVRPLLKSLMMIAKDGKIRTVSFRRDERTRHLLSEMEDSYGNLHANWYGDLEQDAVYQTGSYLPTYPFCRGFLPLMLLSSERITEPSGRYQNHSYAYFDAIIHRTGLGFTGFRKRIMLDRNNRMTTFTYDPQNLGVQLHVENDQESVTTVWNNGIKANQAWNPSISQLTRSNLLTGTESTNKYRYDAFNEPIWSELTYGDNSERVVITTAYNNNITNTYYRIDCPYETTKTTYRGDLSWKEKTVMAYDVRRHPITRWTYVGANNQESETRWTYDARGNVVSEKVAKYGANVFNGEEYTYDSAGRYLISQKNVFGDTSQILLRNRFGQVVREIDSYGKQTDTEIDDWGNVISVQHPTGQRDTTLSSWGGNGVYVIETRSTVAPTVKKHFDGIGRVVKEETLRFDGQWSSVDKEYDFYGRLTRESNPYRHGDPVLMSVTTYDEYDRPILQTEPSGKTSSWIYSGMSVVETVDGITKTTTVDCSGKVVRVDDPACPIHYTYMPNGQLKDVTIQNRVVTSFQYDGLGRQIGFQDLSSGNQTDSYTNSSDGSLVLAHTGGNGTVVTHYDQLGRPVLFVNEEGMSTEYSYDTHGKLIEERGPYGLLKHYAYDEYGRPIGEILRLNSSPASTSASIANLFAYDSSGRQIGCIHSFGGNPERDVVETYIYQNGWQIGSMLQDSTVVWKKLEENSLGKTIRGKTGSLIREYGFSVDGLPGYRKMLLADTPIQDFRYTFDAQTGDLLARSDELHGIEESFTYDNLDRLIRVRVSKNGLIQDVHNYSYDLMGNLTQKSGTGELLYDELHAPFQVVAVNAVDPQAIRNTEQTITYTSFDRPATIHEGNHFASFLYDGAGNRIVMQVSDSVGISLSRCYLGENYEKDVDALGNIKERLYLGGDAYSAPMVAIRENFGDWTMYNIGRDYLGSITLIASLEGDVIAEYSYDPWGKLRDPETAEVYDSGMEPELFLSRGYTAHEHLPWCGLINMNARLYDPALGRFLSPDPYVQMPDFSQAYNAYSYALNNPLKYTDPDGEFFLTWAVTGSGFQVGLNFGFWGFGLFYSWSDNSVGGYLEQGFRIGGTGFGFGATAQESFGYSFANRGIKFDVQAIATMSFFGINTTASLGFSYYQKTENGIKESYRHYSAGLSVSLLWTANNVGVGLGATYDYTLNMTTGESSRSIGVGPSVSLKDSYKTDFMSSAKYKYTWKNGNLHNGTGELDVAFSLNGSSGNKIKKASTKSTYLEDVAYNDLRQKGVIPKYELLPMKKTPFSFSSSASFNIWKKAINKRNESIYNNNNDVR